MLHGHSLIAGVAAPALIVGLTLSAAWARTGEGPRYRGGQRDAELRTVTGRVLELARTPGEGKLPLVSVRIDRGDHAEDVLLAPPRVFEETGFHVSVGDTLQVMLFRGPSGKSSTAQRARNLTTKQSLRFRSLNQIPLWDETGKWQGEPGCANANPAQDGDAGRRNRGRGRGHDANGVN
jgi:hypothetical protein